MSTVVSEPVSQAPRAAAFVPRRVCLVTESAGGGVGRHFLDLASGLATHGLDVVAIYSPGRCDASFRERRERMTGPRFVELPMRRAVHPFDAADLVRLIARIRQEGPFDLVHGHSSKGGALARLAARWLGIPSIYTPHALVTLDPTLPWLKRRLFGGIERWLAGHTAAIIAVSNDEADHARELGIDPRRIRVVLNGIDPPPFPPRDEARAHLGLAKDEFCIGFVGRLTNQKAPNLLIEALAELVPQHCHARLIIVGSGPLEAALQAQIKQLGIGSRVIVCGDVVATTVMPAFDVFCLSSRYEGLPYVLLEALAAGLPIVATRVGGTTTCVQHGENGLIVPPGNASALSSALAALAADEPLRRQFAAASESKSAYFSTSRMVDDTLAVYAKVLCKSNPLR